MPQTYSLSEFLNIVGTVLEDSFPDSYWVRAEISSLQTRNGHAYFDLVQKAENTGILSAKTRAVCWANRYSSLQTMFVDKTGMSLHDGIQVLLQMTVSFHAVYGFSLNIINIDPSFTLGALQQQKQRTIKRLEEEGVIDLNKELLFPKIPRRIAVISSEKAAGYEDFVSQLHNNRMHFAFSVRLFPAIVQGDMAAKSIIEQLSEIYAQSDSFDCVVIIRGGGATTDMSCFDDYDLCSVCAQFPLPILAGIGHTRDNSVLDIVANQMVKTPTAAAEFLIDKMMEEWQYIETLKTRVRQYTVGRVQTKKNEIVRYKMRIKMAMMQTLNQKRQQLLLWQQNIQMRSPEKIYAMGYSLTRSKDGRVIRNVSEVQSGETIITYLREGSIESVVR